jgi:hypothetical protein
MFAKAIAIAYHTSHRPNEQMHLNVNLSRRIPHCTGSNLSQMQINMKINQFMACYSKPLSS